MILTSAVCAALTSELRLSDRKSEIGTKEEEFLYLILGCSQ